MKRIEAALSGKLGTEMVANKTKRIEKALEIAKLNCEENLIKANEELEAVISDSEMLDVECFLDNIQRLLDDKEIAEAGLKKIEAIKAYLNEEVTVEEH